ncbi:PIN domain-containing protein [Variovorax sp. PCZ-1]|uniref:PIN domain-containing protein n=1 Tax=Variovorax sp. PCZ-1 TaxID=2835533 RepID=UPI001BCB83CB|nr:PIN domain-containing protein [Variovorax sp. PCZ-1]MBS7806219.1 PIN domain-containing protein [Variovorax sp. PCZ-1]
MPSALPVFVDTNVLIYAEDRADAHKQSAAKQWLDWLWQNHKGRLSTQTLNEFYVVAKRKLEGISQGDARAKVRRYQAWKPWVLDHQTVETAWGIEANYGFNYWDCLILASAQQQGCAYLLSEDMQDGQLIGSVRIVNPFLHSPESFFQTP